MQFVITLNKNSWTLKIVGRPKTRVVEAPKKNLVKAERD